MKRIALNIHGGLQEQLENYCKKHGLLYSEVGRAALVDYLGAKA